MNDAYSAREERDALENDLKPILAEHLTTLCNSGATATDEAALKQMVTMYQSEGDYSALEIAAYIVGMQGGTLDVTELIAEVTAAIEASIA